jgi:C1A family cysteine protease
MLKSVVDYIWPSVKPVRKYGWKKDKYSERDVATRPELSTFKKFNYHPMLKCINEVDLRPFCPAVVDQGQLGSCTANGLTAAYEFCMIKQEKKYEPMSRLFLYYLEREMEGTVDQDSGAEIHDGVKVMNTEGLCLESLWPYDITKFTVKPDSKCHDDLKLHKAVKGERVQQTMDDMKQCLLDGFPIVVGVQVYESFESEAVLKTGMVSIPDTTTEKLMGGHCMMCCGIKQIDGKDYFIVMNSWGTEVMDKGFCYIPAEYLTNTYLASDFWTIKLVDDEPDSNITDK